MTAGRVRQIRQLSFEPILYGRQSYVVAVGGAPLRTYRSASPVPVRVNWYTPAARVGVCQRHSAPRVTMRPAVVKPFQASATRPAQ
jgi:hypothetical protein